MSSIPLLPGQQTVGEHLSKHHHKKHFFDYKNGLPIVSQPQPNGQGSPNGGGSTHRSMNSIDSPGREDGHVPNFVALDRKVLRFDAWFREAFADGPTEDYRIRKCILYYYLVDDSIRVAEPRVENSGMPQGSFLKRHKVPLNDSFVSWQYLGVGKSVNLYGRELNMTNCDDFTREFYEAQGMPQMDGLEPPSDPYTTKREALHDKTRRHQAKGEDQRWRFLEFNRKVLRFYAAWDDKDKDVCQRRLFVVHYFLEDKTGEIIETKTANSGRDNFPRMLSRQPIPKQYHGLADMGSNAVLTDEDLRIGSTIEVFGRNFFIYGCDESTKEFLKAKYGVEEFPDLEHTVKDETKALPRMQPPPYTGFGTLEDSLGSFYNLVPKVPRRDISKGHLDNVLLRFQAQFKQDTATDEEKARRFVLTFYPSDDTVSIFEPPIKNSGVMGGKFLERRVIYKKDGGMSAVKPDKYTVADFKIGCLIHVHSHVFELYDADTFTKNFLSTGVIRSVGSTMPLDEIHKQIRMCVGKRKAQFLARFRERDHAQDGRVSGKDFLEVIRGYGYPVPPEAESPLVERWALDPPGTVKYIDFVDLIAQR